MSKVYFSLVFSSRTSFQIQLHGDSPTILGIKMDAVKHKINSDLK